MKFKLAENTILIESKVFRVDYKYTESGKTFKDYAYIIGNDKHTTSDMSDINTLLDYMKTKSRGNDLADEKFLQIISNHAHNNFTIVDAKEYKDEDPELIKSYYTKHYKYGNKGHNTDRKQSVIDDNYITHHLSEIEHNKNERNLVGLPKYDDGEKLHQALHLLTISPNTHKGNRQFEVLAYDSIIGAFVPRVLILSAEIK